MKKNGDAYNDISARLIKMRKEYNSLTDDQRKSEVGNSILNQIEEDRQTLICMEAEIGIFHCDSNRKK